MATRAEFERATIAALAEQIRAAGYRAFIAKSGTYGFYTDAAGSRVVSFGLDFGSPKFSGNHVTDSPKSCGSGWQLEPGEFDDMFWQETPQWARPHVRECRAKTLAEYLRDYQSTSQFQEVGTDPTTSEA